MRYFPFIIALFVIVAFWILLGILISPLLKKSGFRLKEREVYGLLLLVVLILAALLFTYYQTGGRFIW